MAFESSGVQKDWRSPVIVPLYMGKRERTAFINYRSASLLSVVVKVYTGFLAEKGFA